MKTLYVSDLDGTLLAPNAEITDFTATVLNSLIAKGLNITVATARTPATAVKMLEKVNFTIPGIFMNGAMLYDLKNRSTFRAEILTHEAKEILLETAENVIHSGFVYCIKDGELMPCYANIDAPNARAFVEERERKYNKVFSKFSSLTCLMDEDVIYYSVSAEKEKLQRANELLSACPDAHTEFYRDIYNRDLWYLEYSAASASKKNGILKLKQLYGFDRIISFGDNLNDISMFEISDESYAVSGANEDVKTEATAVIGSNSRDGVARFLLENFRR